MLGAETSDCRLRGQTRVSAHSRMETTCPYAAHVVHVGRNIRKGPSSRAFLHHAFNRTSELRASHVCRRRRLRRLRIILNFRNRDASCVNRVVAKSYAGSPTLRGKEISREHGAPFSRLC